MAQFRLIEIRHSFIAAFAAGLLAQKPDLAVDAFIPLQDAEAKCNFGTATCVEPSIDYLDFVDAPIPHAAFHNAMRKLNRLKWAV